MKTLAPALLFAGALLFVSAAGAQTLARSPAPATTAPPDSARIDLLIKKIDEQNAKIDILSQQILKLEQQISSQRPGVMIGEATPSATITTTTTATSAASAAPSGGNTHVVARGETLTSIAKMYGVTVTDLQKWNHIDDGRKLQMGQTIVTTPPAGSSPSPAGGE